MIPVETKLLSMLSNNDVTFFIPPYQRNYEWTSEQCEVFLNDVRKTAKSNGSGKYVEHFFGFITFFQTNQVFGQPAKLVLIDGQQRITTTMLFLAALRDLTDDQNLKDFILTKYLKNNNNSDESEYKIKLKQVETDWEPYRKIILREDMTNVEKNSTVYRNYCFFRSRLNAIKANGEDINALISNGLDKFSVVTVQLQPEKNSWENPQEIFESMNSLGKPLSLADLVRNYLLLGLSPDEQTRLYRKYWLHIEKTLGNSVSDYIRDFMQWHERTSYKKATETNYKQLYRQFKSIFNGTNTEETLDLLCSLSDVYKWVLPGGRTGNESIDYELRDLQYIRVTTAYSFLLGLLDTWRKGEFTDDDIVEILDAFRIYCMRRRILGITTNENQIFPQFVDYIPDLQKAQNKRDKMFDILSIQESSLRLPNDVEMTKYIESMNFYNFQYCKLYLSMIEESITKNRPDLSDKTLQIEHIMPRVLNDEWRVELGPNAEEVHQEYVNNIGNLTLIRHNQELGQKTFKFKKDTYENKAGLQIAKNHITDKEKWDKDAIQERMAWIINYLLIAVLPIPKSKRRTNNFSTNDHHGLSFNELQIIGEDIAFVYDPTITAHVINDKEVEFEGIRWKLTPLTREIQQRLGKVNLSGSYQGAQYWMYDGIRLSDIL